MRDSRLDFLFHRGGITSNPNGIGVGWTDLQVAVTTSTTTTIVSSVSYHLTSLSSDTITSFSVPGNRFSGLTLTRLSSLTVPVKVPPPLVGQVEAALDVLCRAGYPLSDYALHDSALENQPRNYTTLVSGVRIQHPWTPGSRWTISDEILGQDTPACRLLPPRCLPSPTMWALADSSMGRNS